jgi:hypothetical protein
MGIRIAQMIALAVVLMGGQAQPSSDHVDRSVALAEATRFLRAAGSPCRVANARYVGRVAGGAMYEASCLAGPGYMVVDAGPSAGATDCSLVWAASLTNRHRAPVCTLPGNTGHEAEIRASAQAAGITCVIDEVLPVGRNARGLMSEIGCDGADGYILVGSGAGARATPCLEAVVVGAATGCRFTTRSEQIATLQGALNPETPCAVTGFRFMGSSDRGGFHQLSCAVGEDWILGQDPAGGRTALPCSESGAAGLTCSP